MTSVRVLVVAPPKLGDWPAALTDLVERYRPDVVGLVDAAPKDVEAVRTGGLPAAMVFIDGAVRGWRQVGPLLVISGGGEVLIVGVVPLGSVMVLASFGGVAMESGVAVSSGTMGYAAVRFLCLVRHVVGVKLEAMQ